VKTRKRKMGLKSGLGNETRNREDLHGEVQLETKHKEGNPLTTATKRKRKLSTAVKTGGGGSGKKEGRNQRKRWFLKQTYKG